MVEFIKSREIRDWDAEGKREEDAIKLLDIYYPLKKQMLI